MDMEEFLDRVRRHLDSGAPHLRRLFDRMAGEARFARAWLEEDLRGLPRGAQVLEVGGGVFLLACQLAREGFRVTTIEPTGIGFGSFEELGRVALSLAASEGFEPTVARCAAESFESDAHFALAFSVNVMEHVEAPDRVIARVSAALSAGGSYRFLCPNYLFPYEPHFNMPTLGSKALTWRLLRRSIATNANVRDPAGLWQSLNWITVPKVQRIAGAQGSLDLHFSTGTLAWMLERALSDDQFAGRRAPWMVSVIRVFKALRLLPLVRFVPARLQPVMDVRLTKRV
jgi:SAM-dependent methyltransferase